MNPSNILLQRCWVSQFVSEVGCVEGSTWLLFLIAAFPCVVSQRVPQGIYYRATVMLYLDMPNFVCLGSSSNNTVTHAGVGLEHLRPASHNCRSFQFVHTLRLGSSVQLIAYTSHSILPMASAQRDLTSEAGKWECMVFPADAHCRKPTVSVYLWWP